MRTFSLLYPSPGTVIYKRESTNDFWVRRRNHVLESIPPSSPVTKIRPEYTLDFIQAAASYELNKELDFLHKFYPATENQGASLIEKFNILF